MAVPPFPGQFLKSQHFGSMLLNIPEYVSYSAFYSLLLIMSVSTVSSPDPIGFRPPHSSFLLSCLLNICFGSHANLPSVVALQWLW